MFLLASVILFMGGLCMMSLPVWLTGLMFLLGGLCLWSHVLSVGLCQGVSVWGSLYRGVSVQGVSFQECLFPGGLSVQGVSLSGGGLCLGGYCPGGSVRGPPWQRTPLPPPRLRAGSTHPTEMLSCFCMCSTFSNKSM